MSEVTFTDANFEDEVEKSDLPVLVDFHAPWCGPCKMQGPVVEKLAGEYAGKVKIGQMNVDENQATAPRFSVLSIPTLILFKGGQPVETMVGFQDEATLKAKLDALAS